MRTFDLTRNQGNNAIFFTRFSLVAQALKLVAVPCGPQRRPVPQNKTNSNTSVSQHFLPIDYEPENKKQKNTLCQASSAPPPAAALCAAARHPAPLRGAPRRPSGALRAPRAARATFLGP